MTDGCEWNPILGRPAREGDDHFEAAPAAVIVGAKGQWQERPLPPDRETTVGMLRFLLEYQEEIDASIRVYPCDVEVKSPSYYRVVLWLSYQPIAEIKRLMRSIPCDQQKRSEHD